MYSDETKLICSTSNCGGETHGNITGKCISCLEKIKPLAESGIANVHDPRDIRKTYLGKFEKCATSTCQQRTEDKFCTMCRYWFRECLNELRKSNVPEPIQIPTTVTIKPIIKQNCATPGCTRKSVHTLCWICEKEQRCPRTPCKTPGCDKVCCRSDYCIQCVKKMNYVKKSPLSPCANPECKSRTKAGICAKCRLKGFKVAQ